MAKLNITHLVTTREDEIYGGDAIILSLLKNFDSRNFNHVVVSILRLKQKGKTPLLLKEAHKLNIRTEIVYLVSHFDLMGIFSIRKLLENLQTDILHSHDYQSNFFGFFASLFSRVKTICTIHGWLGFARIKGNFKAEFHEAIDLFIRRNLDKIIAISISLKERLIKNGCRPDKVELIYNGIDVDELISTKGTDVRRDLSLSPSTKIIGTVGRLSVEKGYNYLLEAAVPVLNTFPDTIFMFVGDGPQKENLINLAKKLAIKEKVIFTGFRKDVFNLISAMDIFVFPSLWEGFGLSLIQAMACGKPVISTKVGISTEIIIDGEDGILVDTANSAKLSDAIMKLLPNKELCDRMGMAARKIAQERFSEKEMVRKYEKIYEIMVDRDAYGNLRT